MHVYISVLQCIVFQINSIKNEDPYFGKVKIKSYAAIPLSVPFPWAWEGKSLAFFFKTFKIPKSVPL